MNGYRIFLATVLASSISASVAGAAELVVFEASGGSFAPGQVVDGDAPLKLAAGESVTLISTTGKMLKLDGPFDKAPAPQLAGGSGGVIDALQGLVGQRGKNTGSLGVTREVKFGEPFPKEAAKSALPPGPWMIDAGGSGDWCYREREAVVLWRQDVMQALPVELSLPGQDWKAGADWPAGKDRVSAPPDMPLGEGAVMAINLGGRKATVVLHPVPAAVPSREAHAAWLAQKNCRIQAEALLNAPR